MKKILRIILIVVTISFLAFLFLLPKPNQTTANQPTILASSYIGYDFARTLTTNTQTQLELLVTPGTDLHSYEPTPQDIIKIKNSTIFIYNGGESENWLNRILQEIDANQTTIIRMMDAVELTTENDTQILENTTSTDSESATEYDEHIWTSPQNAIKILQQIEQALSTKLPQYQTNYRINLDRAISELNQLDADFRTLAKSTDNTIFVADRFPFRYFVDEYGFNYLAIFPGCSEQTEASAQTIATFVDAVNHSQNKTIFHIELSNQTIAQTIADATGAEILELHSMHNISQDDFIAGKTYLDFMRNNYQNLKKALNATSQSH